MKKILLLSVLALGAFTANAQEVVEEPAFSQNWSIGVDAGATTPLHHAAFFGDMRGLFGVNIKKQITPTFGLGVEGQFGVNTSSWINSFHRSTTMFDNSYVGTFGTVDVLNLICGYKCEPRFFSLEVLGGAGWGHNYFNHELAKDQNYFATKVGLNINLNLCKYVTLAFKPSIVWNMNHGRAKQSETYYNIDGAVFNIQAGLVCHLGGTNFECVKPYNQAEIDALNAQINDLRAELDAALANGAAWEAKVAGLAQELAACMNRKPEVVEVVKQVDTNTLQSVRYVFFRLASSVITSDQMPNVEMIAAYLKNHKDSKVIIKGYASKDGSLDFNIKLANARAEAVRNALINKYGIKANRIQAEGQGIGEMFKEESWNRVAICTIEDK